MHALASLRRNAPSPPPVAAPGAASPRLPDPNAVLAQLERAIAATEYSYASAQLAALSSKAQATRSVQEGTSSQHHGSAIASQPGARVNGECRRSDGADTHVDAQHEDGRSGRAGHEKIPVFEDSSILQRQAGKLKPLRKASVPGSADTGDVTGSDVEVIHRRRSLSKTVSTVENGRIPDGEMRSYDASAADQAFRAGSSALAEGAPSEALLHLRLALAKCPPDKPSALAKIQRVISVAQDQLETQRSADPAARRKTNQVVPSSEIAGQGAGQGGGYPDKLPMKVLQVGDVEAADNSYRAGVSALEKGDPAKALEYLDKAARACPPDRPAAFAKIQLLIGQAHFELRLD